MISLLEDLPAEERKGLEKEAMPSEPSPMLAVLVHDSFSDPEWIFERKFDGERALCLCRGGRVRLLSRNGKDLSPSYPEIVDALDRNVSLNLLADGEIVAFDDGVTSFSRLQKRMQISDPQEARNSPVAVYYYLFDILHLDGRRVTDLALRARKNLLRKAVEFSDPLRYSRHRNEDGEAYHREACRKGWEGIMAKRAQSPYTQGRSRDWRKFKCVARQEFVIGGYTEPGGTREGFGALLVGYYEEGGLQYAGKVGTGFDDETLRRMARRMRRIQRKTPPFSSEDEGDLPKNGVHWITPKLVGEFGFTEWTTAGKLRHPRFLGLRRDKDPEEVTREQPQEEGDG
jgi:DNA ligase D-like protein (predicted ligase)